MQPYKQSISRDGTHIKPEVGRTDAALLAKGTNQRVARGRKGKVLVLIDVWMSITITGV
jgi:hypothetical protein